MRIYFIIIFGAVLCWNDVIGNGENDVKRGTFPFMAFIYYPHEAASASGPRFTRSAILIHPQWLISSSIKVGDSSSNFPQTTLLARVGAISIDLNVTLNEDEEEQEREVIQVVRPFNSSETEWWATDISLLKTLLPFNISSAVATTPLPSKQDNIEGICSILLYARLRNATEDRILMQMSVQLTPSPENNVCGSYFIKKSMACAAYPDEKNSLIYDANFCEGNDGGPLVCGNKVMGLQTYINSCEKPYLYQLLTAWEDFINCGTGEKCHDEHCSNICITVDKDQPYSNSISSLTQNTDSVVTDRTDDPSIDDSTNLSNYETITNKITDRFSYKDEEIVPTTEESVSNLPTKTTLKKKKTTTSKDRLEQKVEDTEMKNENAELKASESSEQILGETVEQKSVENIEERDRNTNVEAKKLKDAATTSTATMNIAVLYMAAISYFMTHNFYLVI